MPTQQDVTQQMLALLSVAEPSLDASIGSPVRSMLDVVAEVIAEAYADVYLLSYQYDINTKSGSDLDNYVAQFGFTRNPGQRATGTVTFSRTSEATADIYIAAGTQVADTNSPPDVFNTLTPVILATGTTSCTVPIQAQIAGVAGNVAAATITACTTLQMGFSSVSNANGLGGGSDAESDDQLRARFVATVFRALTGTEAMFEAVALDDPDVTLVNVIGSAETYNEMIQIVDGTATSGVQALKYFYPDTSTLIDMSGNYYTPGVDYSITSTDNDTPPVITSLGVSCPDGLYQLQYNYLPLCSRNDPANGITNCVDIYCNGLRQVEATQDTQWIDTNVFNDTADSPLYVGNFERLDGQQPSAGNFFIPFYFTPLIAASTTGQIEISDTVYYEGVDYFAVNNITAFGMAPQSASGIEWLATGGPASGTAMSLDYFFNQIPTSVQTAVQTWTLVTTDVMVHQAQQVWLNFYLGIILANSYSQATVQSQIETAIANYLTSLTYDSVVQVSEILSIVQQIPGVIAVRFLTSADEALAITPVNAQSDGTNYAIQSVTPPGEDGNEVIHTYASLSGSPLRAVDVALNDDTLPALNNVYVAFMAQNTFGSV
jgi:uncharacterized phage protein gp47/JayE